MNKQQIAELFDKIKKMQGILNSIESPTGVDLERFKKEAKFLWSFLNNFTVAVSGREIPRKEWRMMPRALDITKDFAEVKNLFNKMVGMVDKIKSEVGKYT